MLGCPVDADSSRTGQIYKHLMQPVLEALRKDYNAMQEEVPKTEGLVAKSNATGSRPQILGMDKRQLELETLECELRVLESVLKTPNPTKTNIP